jgi:hypothetical protein
MRLRKMYLHPPYKFRMRGISSAAISLHTQPTGHKHNRYVREIKSHNLVREGYKIRRDIFLRDRKQIQETQRIKADVTTTDGYRYVHNSAKQISENRI